MPPSRRVVLASRSPRRRELLTLLGLAHHVAPATIDESQRADESPLEHARRVAREKAAAVALRYPDEPVLAADTVVDLDGRSLGKPTSTDDAALMLRALSGRDHRVHTGVALVADRRTACLVDTATVWFRPLAEDAIRWYVATGEPMDKAGAYAVQGAGGVLVERVDGSPHTVIGLPLQRLPELFGRAGLDLWSLLSGPDG